MGNVVEVNTKKLRSVQKLFQMLKAIDPETDVTAYFVRRIVYQGYIPSVECGNKKLACFEDLCAYLYDGRRWHNE